MTNTKQGSAAQRRRVYPLDARELTQEQLAVVFAMTSRRPEPFDEIRDRVTTEKAADFHERWVLGYGHASVAEHAIIHMAVEGISRLAADELEDNRLASYTEKSSRYQIIEPKDYFVPPELEHHSLLDNYTHTCNYLFDTYHAMVARVQLFLTSVRPRHEGERDTSYTLRLRREATDSCRFLLPAATITNIGLTMNARSMEHAIRKLFSSNLIELHELGEELKIQGQETTPTLIKYTERNPYLVLTRESQESSLGDIGQSQIGKAYASLVHWDDYAEAKIVAAILYRVSNQSYTEIWSQVQSMSEEELASTIDLALKHLGPFDAPIRELEFVNYTFDLMMDYGAYREYKRHRLQSYIPQSLTVEHGYLVPDLLIAAGEQDRFDEAMAVADDGFASINTELPLIAPYLVTHAHYRRVLATMNLRESYHLFKIRTALNTHFSLRQVMQEAKQAAASKHPLLFKYLVLRDT